MTQKKKPSTTTKTITAGGAMLVAAFTAFSLNQGGLTGRATGGAVGCGGPGESPVASSSESEGLLPGGSRFVIEHALSADGFDLIQHLSPVHAPTVALADEGPAVVSLGVPDSLSEALSHEKYRAFNRLIDASGLRPVFDNTSASFTVFAPNDTAMEAWGQLTTALEPQNLPYARAIVEHHMIRGKERVNTVPDEVMDTLVPGQRLTIDREARTVRGGNSLPAQVMDNGFQTTSSLVHEIDAVLVPAATTMIELELSGFTMFATMVRIAGLDETYGDPSGRYTIIAPPNVALMDAGINPADLQTPSPGMEGNIAEIVRNHVIEGVFRDFSDVPEGVTTVSGIPVESRAPDQLALATGEEINLVEMGVSQNGVVFQADTVLNFQF